MAIPRAIPSNAPECSFSSQLLLRDSSQPLPMVQENMVEFWSQIIYHPTGNEDRSVSISPGLAYKIHAFKLYYMLFLENISPKHEIQK